MSLKKREPMKEKSKVFFNLTILSFSEKGNT